MAYDASTVIKQVKVDSSNFDLDAKYWNGHEWTELSSALKFVGTVATTAPSAGNYKVVCVKLHGATTVTKYYVQVTTTGTATEIASEKGDVAVKTDTGEEFLCTTAGLSTDSTQNVWAELGDETNFQLTGKTLTSGGPSTNATGSAGSQTAVGTATISYQRAASVTYNAGAATINGSSFSFTGTAATLTSTGSFTPKGTISVAVNSHTYTPAGTLSGTQSIPAHSHTVNAITSSKDVITAVGNAASAGAHTHSITPSLATLSYISGGSTVSVVTGVEVDGTASAIVSGATITNAGAHTHKVDVATTSSGTLVTSATLTAGGAHTHSITPSTVSIEYVTGSTLTATVLTGVKSSGSNSFVTGATIGGVDAHSHTVNTATASFTAVTSISDFSGGSFKQGSKASYTGHSFSAGSLPSFTQGSKAAWGATVSSGVLSFSWSANGSDTFSAGSLPSHSVGTFTANGDDTFTAASLGTQNKGTITYVTGATLSTAGAHSHTFNPTTATAITGVASDGTATAITKLATASKTVVTGVTATGEAGSHSHTVNAATTAFDYVSGATIESAGGHSHSISNTVATVAKGVKASSSATVISGLTGASKQFVTNVTATGEAGAHTHSVSSTSTPITYMTGATLDLDGDATVNFANGKFNGTQATIAHTVGTASFTGTAGDVSVSTSYTPAGSIGGSVSIASHTHTISLVSESVSGTAAVSVSAHTHDLSNHTHNVTTKN